MIKMDKTVKIGMVNSPNYNGIRYQVFLDEVSGIVWIESEIGMNQVGENVDVNSPTKAEYALRVAFEFLKKHEDVFKFKRYF